MEASPVSHQKKIAGMFSSISGRYDFLNSLFSFGLDTFWRKWSVKIVLRDNPEIILDIASGTGKVAFEILRQKRNVRIFCMDPSLTMLEIARKQSPACSTSLLSFICGVAEGLPFQTNKFEAVTAAFGVRNFADLEAGLKEILRVLKPGGVFVILEFSMPDNPLLKFIYNFYLGYTIPLIGQCLSRSKAYFYLRDTVRKFPRDEEFKNILKKIGFVNVSYVKYTTGVVACYRCEKPKISFK